MQWTHTPVLLRESMEILSPQPGDVVLDGTLGLGGHAEKFLEAVGPSGRLIGIDADKKNLETARERLQRFGERVTLLHANFRMLSQLGLPQVDILFADLGLSSPHIDDPDRGFTFRADAPLDLRFDRESGPSAAHMLRSMNEHQLFRMFADLGEVPRSKALAETLFQELRRGSLVDKEPRTGDIVRIVERLYGQRSAVFLPQIFQALRMAVNDELGSLETLLREGPQFLMSGGRMGIISYHSLEDRMVKETFRELSSPEIDPLRGTVSKQAPFELLIKKGIQPDEEERKHNPRSRSARLRGIRKRKS